MFQFIILLTSINFVRGGIQFDVHAHYFPNRLIIYMYVVYVVRETLHIYLFDRLKKNSLFQPSSNSNNDMRGSRIFFFRAGPTYNVFYFFKSSMRGGSISGPWNLNGVSLAGP